mmetsp:Transcript_12342/g.33677  ORF Transcript_12342/g.33677 Transcript_12342/m.33677 type:complete len:712 (+) Transcript_12342:598-2733(+)
MRNGWPTSHRTPPCITLLEVPVPCPSMPSSTATSNDTWPAGTLVSPSSLMPRRMVDVLGPYAEMASLKVSKSRWAPPLMPCSSTMSSTPSKPSSSSSSPPPTEARVSSSSSSGPSSDQPLVAASAFESEDRGQGLICMANAIATFGSKMPTPASAEQSDALAELEDAVQSHLSHVLLLAHMHAVAAHLGWRWLKLPLTSMDEVQGDLVVVLDGAGEVEQLQTLLRLCRFADRCRDVPFTDGPGLIEAATDGGMLELEHEGTWSYWEQILGWACWRPWAPPEPPPQPNVAKERPKADAKKPGPAQPAEKGKARGKKAGPHPPKLGKVALRFRLTQPHQEWAAATLIQAAWRGWAARQLHVAELKFDLLPNPQCLKELEKARRRVYGAWEEDIEEAELAREPSAQQLPESQHESRELGSKDSRQFGSQRVQFSRCSTMRGERLGSGSMASSFDFKRSSSCRRALTGIGFLGALRHQHRRPSLHRSSTFGPGAKECLEDARMQPDSETGSRSDTIGGRGSTQQDDSSSDSSESGIDLQEALTAQISKGKPSVDLSALRKMATMQSKEASHAVSAFQPDSRPQHMYKSSSGLVAVKPNEEQLTARGGSRGDLSARSQRSDRGRLLREEVGMLARAATVRAHALAAASAFCSRARGSKVPQMVAARWQYAWLACKVHRREQRMQLLATRMCVKFAQKEMQANADHLFPWPPPEPTS